jgi:hypothetical protein
MEPNRSLHLWSWLLFIAAEAFLYVSYQQNDGRFHWFLHFFVGASATLIVLGLIMVLSGHIVRLPLLWLSASNERSGNDRSGATSRNNGKRGVNHANSSDESLAGMPT